MQIFYIFISCQILRLIPEISVYVVILKPLRTRTPVATGSKLACALAATSSVLSFHHYSLIIRLSCDCRNVCNTIIGYFIVSFQYPLASGWSVVAV